MRHNQPVTQREYEFPADATLMSTTNTQSHITYANAAFIAVSGFEREEIIGQAHNMVRHPDMPTQAFADMWATLKAGRSWTALVKNRRKTGDHYWVRANATPVVRGGKVIGYMSVRTKPLRAEIEATEAVYRAFREGRGGRWRFHQGLIVRSGAMAWASWLQVMPVRWRLRLGVLSLTGGTGGGAAATGGGKINAASHKARLKQASDAEEKAALKTAIKLFEAESQAKKAVKEAQEALDRAVVARYPKLTESEIKQLLVEDKWRASLQAAIEAEIERITQQLANRVKELEERYSATLPQLTQQVADLEAKVAAHLKSMGLEWTR